jgi:hypothetical protein
MNYMKAYLGERKSSRRWMKATEIVFYMWLGIIGSQLIRLAITSWF